MTRRRGGGLRPRGRDAEDGRAADEPRRRRAPAHAVRRRDRAGSGSAATAAEPAADRPVATAPPDRGGPAARPDPGRSTGRGPPPGRRASRPRGAARAPPRPDAAVTAARATARPGGRRHAPVPAPDPIAARLPPARPPARPAHPGARRRLLRPGRPQGAGRHGAAPAPGAAARRRASRSRERVAREVAEPDRRAWLIAQLVALETQAAALAGEPLPYLELRRRGAWGSPRRATTTRSSTRPSRAIDALLPGAGLARGPAGGVGSRSSRSRSIACPSVVDWLVERFRERAARDFGLPDGEDLRVSLVTRPAVVALQLVRRRPAVAGRHQHRPARSAAPDLIVTVAHETYPGPPPRARLEGGRPGRAAAAGSRRRSSSSTRPSA